MDLVGLLEKRRPGRCEISREGYTYYWSGMGDGTCIRGIAVGMSSRLLVEITIVKERIMQVRMKHIGLYFSCCTVYARAEKAAKKDAFYGRLISPRDWCPPNP